MTPRFAHCIKSCIVSVLAGLALCLPAAARPEDQAPPPLAADAETSRNLAQAEGFHDLAILYMKTGEMEKALEASRQIVHLRFPAAFQKAVAQSLSIITEKFAENRRVELGQALLDEALRSPGLEPIYPRLHRNKARLCMMAGDNDCAIRHWRKALESENRPER
jgi:tetratricopeptide (TPR) repeat protein